MGNTPTSAGCNQAVEGEQVIVTGSDGMIGAIEIVGLRIVDDNGEPFQTHKHLCVKIGKMVEYPLYGANPIAYCQRCRIMFAMNKIGHEGMIDVLAYGWRAARIPPPTGTSFGKPPDWQALINKAHRLLIAELQDIYKQPPGRKPSVVEPIVYEEPVIPDACDLEWGNPDYDRWQYRDTKPAGDLHGPEYVPPPMTPWHIVKKEWDNEAV